MEHKKTCILDVPNELILLVTSHLEFEIDFNSLCRTNRGLHALLNPILYKHCVFQQRGMRTLNWAAERGLASTCRLLMEAGELSNAGNSDNQYWWTFALAASYGYIEVVQLLFGYGVDPCTTDNEWRNFDFDTDNWRDTSPHQQHRVRDVHPLCLAAEDGEMPIIKILLECGVQPALCTDNNGDPTALCYAAASGYDDIVRLLCDAGSPINVYRRDRGQSPLAHAASRGNLEMVQFLLSCGADPNLAFELRDTPLYAASFSGNIDVVQCLLDHGAALNPTCHDGQNPFFQLFRAAKLEYHDIVDLFLARFDYIEFSTEPFHQTILLCVAAMTGRIALLTDLLTKYNYNPNFRLIGERGFIRQGSGGETLDALACATEYNQIKAMEILLSHGAHNIPPDGTPGKGDPHTFSYAVENNSIEAIKTLIAYGVDINIPWGDALAHALRRPAIFSLLLSLGANPVCPPELYHDVFRLALYCNAVDAMEILLDLPGSKELFIEPLEVSPISWGPHLVFDTALRSEKVFRLFLERGLVTVPKERLGYLTMNWHINRIMLKDSPSFLRLFVKLNFDELAANNVSDLVYHAATSLHRNKEMLDVVQEFGFDIESRNEKGGTPLVRAVFFGRSDAVKELLKRGADPLAAYKSGTVFSYVIESGYLYVLGEILQFFDESGLGFYEIERIVKPAQKLALEKGHTKIYRELCRFYWRKRYPVPISPKKQSTGILDRMFGWLFSDS